jgi:flagellar basal-body rod protein FlgC
MSTGGITGVTVAGVTQDTRGEFKRVLEPGHPDADANGYVAMPNIDLPVEMMHMVAATRAYEANAAVLKRYQDNVEITLELLR